MPGIVKPAKTLYDKVFDDHVVDEKEDGTILLYIGKFRIAASLMGLEALTKVIQTDIWYTK